MGGVQSGQLADDVVSVFKRTVTLTDAELKALPTTPIEIVPAVAGKILKFISAIVIIDVQAGVYTNVHADLFIEFAYASGNTVSSYLLDAVNDLTDPGAVFIEDMVPYMVVGPSRVLGSSQVLADAQSHAIRLKADNGGSGNFTGGHANNTVKATVLYMVIDA